MKIVKLKGGLGNQMFQYAYALLLQKKTGEDVYIDYSAYRNLKNDTIRVPRITSFQITLPEATDKQLKKVCLFSHSSNSQSFIYRLGIYIESKLNKRYMFEPNRAFIDPHKIDGFSYYDGYWQSWRYVAEVREIIDQEYIPRKELSEKTKDTRQTMRNQNSVFIGVRRGDYGEEAAHYGSFSSSYYEEAMAYIDERVQNPVYYVFSNDIAWCKRNINWGKHNVVFRQKQYQTSDFEELALMSSCKHAIIINSSFHWWGATLIENTEKIVCCPTKWWFDDKPIDIIPPEWVRIEDRKNGRQ